MAVVPGAADAADAADAALWRRVAWRTLPLVFLAYAVAALDRVNLGYAKGPMLAEHGWGDAVYALGAGLFFLGYVAFDVPSSLAAQRFGLRRWLVRILVTRGLVVMALSQVHSPLAFYLLRGLLGVAEAGLIPCLLVMLARWFPAARRGGVMAVFLSAIAVAGAIGGPLAGVVLRLTEGWWGGAGWQWLFALGGGLSVLAGLGVALGLAETPEQARWLTPVERQRLRAALGPPAAPDPAPYAALGPVLRRPVVWGWAAAYFCFIFGFYGVAFWLPPLLQAAGTQDPLWLGLLGALPYACGTLVMTLASRHADHTGERRWHLILAALAGALGLLGCGLAGNAPVVALAALVLAASGCLAVLPLFWTLPSALLHGAAAAAGMAFINAVGNLGGLASPLAVAAVREAGGSLPLAMALQGGVQAAGALMVWALTRRR